MKHGDLEVLLSVFKQTREQLVYDFNNENIEIYDPMFRYEKDKHSMSISIDKYFMSWIDSHFKVFESLTRNDDRVELVYKFTKVMLLLVEKSELSIRASEIERGKQLFFDMLDEKKHLLQNLDDISIKSDFNYKKLGYLYQKDKALFERKLSEFLKEKV
jgi:hypothetical protein